jgi:hypothetical protein
VEEPEGLMSAVGLTAGLLWESGKEAEALVNDVVLSSSQMENATFLGMLRQNWNLEKAHFYVEDRLIEDSQGVTRIRRILRAEGLEKRRLFRRTSYNQQERG